MKDDIEVMVQCLVSDMPVSAMRQEQIRAAATEDPDLQMVRQAAMMGWPKKKRSAPIVLQDYWPVKDQVHIADGLLCVGDCIMILSSLKSEMLALLHESHMGAEKTKARATGALFWPNMTADVEQTVVNCVVCLSHRNAQPKEPLRPHPIPELAWQKVGADVLTYQSKDYLLVVDYYSKYPEVV